MTSNNKKKIDWYRTVVSVSSYDSSYQSLLNRGTSLGYGLPSLAQQVKQNQMVLDLKAAGIWSLLDLFQVYATDGDSDFATLNWISPSSFQSTKVNSPTFASNIGFNSNGSTSYLNSNWNPAGNGVNYTLDGASMFGYIHTNSSNGTARDFGGMGNSGGANMGATLMNARNASNVHSYLINRNTSTLVSTGTATVSSQGLFLLQRTASNAQRLFRNGVQVGADETSASGNLSERNFYIGAQNSNGTTAGYSTRQIGCFGVGASLSGLENSLYTIWNTYFSSL